MKKRSHSISRRVDNIDIVDCSFATRAGFSILELASVLAILVLIIGASIGAFLGWQRAAVVRGSNDQVYSALTRARQFAITHRMPTGVAFGVTNAPGYPRQAYIVTFTNSSESSRAPSNLDYRNGVQVAPTIYLPLRTAVYVNNPWQTINGETDIFVIRFLPDGRAQQIDDNGAEILLGVARSKSSGDFIYRGFRLDPLTGMPRSVEIEEERAPWD